jgi:hypothetical protein
MMDGMRAPAAGGGTLGQGLIVHYKMNDNAASTVVVDSMANVNGTAQRNTSLLTTNGVIGSALYFNGSSDGIGVVSNTSLNFGTGTFSVAFWGYRDMTRGYYMDRVGDRGPIAIDGDAAHPNQLMMYDNAAWRTTSSNIAVSSWHHIVMTRNATAAKWYIDGNGPTDMAISGSFSSVGNLIMGAHYTMVTQFLLGRLDDFRLYNRVLTASEVLQLYNGGAGTEDE